MPIPAAVPIIASVGSVASNILGSIFGSSSQDKANEANLQATRETNALNERLFYENLQNQNLWNERAYTEYWKQRKYDSIANQRAQYERGGINPYFALGNMQTGLAAGSTPSPSGGSSTPSMSIPTFGAYDPSQSFANVGNAISQGVSSYYENSLKKAEATQKDLQNLNQIDKDLAEIAEKRAAAKKSGADASYLDEQEKALKEQRPVLLENLKKSGRLLRAQEGNTMQDTRMKEFQSESIGLQNQAAELSNEVFRDTKEFQKKSIMLGVRKILSEVNLNSSSAAYQIAAKFLSECQSKGVQIDNFQKNQINWMIREGVKLDNMLKKQDLGLDDKWYTGKYNPLNTLFNALVGVGAGVATGYAAGAGMSLKMGAPVPKLGPKLINQYGAPLF